jgi:hypothetical protein
MHEGLLTRFGVCKRFLKGVDKIKGITTACCFDMGPCHDNDDRSDTRPPANLFARPFALNPEKIAACTKSYAQTILAEIANELRRRFNVHEFEGTPSCTSLQRAASAWKILFTFNDFRRP